MSQRVILPEHRLDFPRCVEVPYTEADPEDEDEEEVGSLCHITSHASVSVFLSGVQAPWAQPHVLLSVLLFLLVIR